MYELTFVSFKSNQQKMLAVVIHAKMVVCVGYRQLVLYITHVHVQLTLVDLTVKVIGILDWFTSCPNVQLYNTDKYVQTTYCHAPYLETTEHMLRVLLRISEML